jgi:hypothetical protein
MRHVRIPAKSAATAALSKTVARIDDSTPITQI